MTTLNATKRRRLIGTVTSTRMAKTIVVKVERQVQHPKYGKTYTVSNSFKAHDETSQAHMGETVEIEETRPISRDKRWRYARTITSAK